MNIPSLFNYPLKTAMADGDTFWSPIDGNRSSPQERQQHGDEGTDDGYDNQGDRCTW